MKVLTMCDTSQGLIEVRHFSIVSQADSDPARINQPPGDRSNIGVTENPRSKLFIRYNVILKKCNVKK